MLDKIVRRLRSPKSQSPITPADVLASLYTRSNVSASKSYYFNDLSQLKTPRLGDQLPVPPAHLRMGYNVDADANFLKGGEASASALRALMQTHGILIDRDAVILDWGCATGRALRWFAPEAHTGEFWGADQDEASIAWDKENLSPPFHFVTCTAYPHLPFGDNKFSLIYGLSVFTHLEHFRDLWLMELKRIMRPGAHAIFTVHDENTIQFFMKDGHPHWIPTELTLSEIPKHDVTIIHGELWYQTYTFFTTDYIRREWGRYFQILEIRPMSEGYQSAVVLRKT